MSTYNLLTWKPVIYAANVAEGDLADDGESNSHVQAVRKYAAEQNSEIFVICAEIEEEISELDDDEKKMFLEDLGLTESGLEKLVKASYHLLGLMSFLTSGEDETRAWTIKIGTKAPQAAGKIHTDFERGFIKAEVVNYQDLLDCGSYAGDVNKPEILDTLRMMGSIYVVRGNNDKDWAEGMAKTLHFTIEGVKFFMTHNKKDVDWDLKDTQVVIFGHTHKYFEKMIDNRLWLNPGSCGPRRFDQEITMAVMTVDNGTYQWEKVAMIPEK